MGSVVRGWKGGGQEGKGEGRRGEARGGVEVGRWSGGGGERLATLKQVSTNISLPTSACASACLGGQPAHQPACWYLPGCMGALGCSTPASTAGSRQAPGSCSPAPESWTPQNHAGGAPPRPVPWLPPASLEQARERHNMQAQQAAAAAAAVVVLSA